MSLAHASLVVGDLAGAGLVEREHDDNEAERFIDELSRLVECLRGENT